MSFGATTSDTVGFFRAWLAAPLRVAAPVPSSQALAKIMASELSAASGPVIELGPGTGVCTQAMMERGLPQEALTLIELGPEFAAKLGQRFPQARILRMDAEALRGAGLFAERKAGATVSGLPLLSMPPRKVIAILEGAFENMRPEGAFYQFTYGPRCPVSRRLLDRLDLKATRIGGVLGNLPPASVYRIKKRAARPAP